MEQRDYMIALGIWIAFTGARLLYRLLDKYIVTPNIGEYPGHVIGVVIMIGLIALLTYLFVKNLQIQTCNNSDFIFVGIFWFLLSAATLFVYYRYIGEDTWKPFLREIDISRGGLWVFALLAELIAPPIFGMIRLHRHFKRRRRRSYRT